MKKFFKTLAILIIIAHIFAGMIHAGIIPVRLFQNLKLPEPGRLAEFILRLQGEIEQDRTGTGEAVESLEKDISTNTLETEETGEGTSKVIGKDEQMNHSESGKDIRIELSETLPPLEEEDLYDLVHVLVNADALRAVDGQGVDYSDQIICELAADIADPGHFTAVFSLKAEDGQIKRGPSANMYIEMTEPFLGFRQDEVAVTVGTDYNPRNNILICMDIDGTVLTEFVEYEGYLNTDQTGDYELRFIIYSRVNTSFASRKMMIHVVDR